MILEVIFMKILSIGNSFSMDATHYLNRMAKSCGLQINTVNLYIGGCSLYTHYINAVENLSNYTLDFNGFYTGFQVSIKQALISNDYDIVTLQQASHFSFKPETYEPYLSYLAEYVRKYCPHAKIFIHQTWGYNPGEARLGEMGFLTHRSMYDEVEKSYDKAFQIIGGEAYGLIPCGKTMCALVESGISSSEIFRDAIHAGFGLGRYALALTWLEYLAEKSAFDCDFSDFDAEVDMSAIECAKKAAHEACVWAEKYRK